MKKSSIMTILLLGLVTACAQTSGSATKPAAQEETAILEGYHWQLSSAEDNRQKPINALFVQADKPVQLDMQEGRILISNTCNHMSGPLTIKGNTMVFGDIVSTMRLCIDDRINALDREVGKLLTGSVKFAMTRSMPPRLMITTAQGDKLTFNAIPTAETRYGSNGEIAFLEIAAQKKPCSNPGQPKARCLQVREVYYDENGLKKGKPGAWENFYQNIEGYQHKEGVRNILRVKRYTVKNPPADGSSVAYVLDMTVATAMEK